MEARQSASRTPYETYLETPEEVKCELINGEIVMMGAPSDAHQHMCGELFYQLRTFLHGHRCQVRMSPGVQFREEEPINNAIQPDIAVVCAPEKFKKQGIVGAPDFIVEVVSPLSASYDAITKRNLYEIEGVREYWIVDPQRRTVYVFMLDNGRYETTIYSADDHVPVSVLQGCTIDMAAVFSPIIGME